MQDNLAFKNYKIIRLLENSLPLVVLINHSEHTQEFRSASSDKNLVIAVYIRRQLAYAQGEKLCCWYIFIKYLIYRVDILVRLGYILHAGQLYLTLSSPLICKYIAQSIYILSIFQASQLFQPTYL